MRVPVVLEICFVQFDPVYGAVKQGDGTDAPELVPSRNHITGSRNAFQAFKVTFSILWPGRVVDVD